MTEVRVAGFPTREILVDCGALTVPLHVVRRIEDYVDTDALLRDDCAAALGVLCGFDPNDSTSADLPFPDVLADLDTPVDDQDHADVAWLKKNILATQSRYKP